MAVRHSGQVADPVPVRIDEEVVDPVVVGIGEAESVPVGLPREVVDPVPVRVPEMVIQTVAVAVLITEVHHVRVAGVEGAVVADPVAVGIDEQVVDPVAVGINKPEMEPVEAADPLRVPVPDPHRPEVQALSPEHPKGDLRGPAAPEVEDKGVVAVGNPRNCEPPVRTDLYACGSSVEGHLRSPRHGRRGHIDRQTAC